MADGDRRVMATGSIVGSAAAFVLALPHHPPFHSMAVDSLLQPALSSAQLCQVSGKFGFQEVPGAAGSGRFREVPEFLG